MGRTKDYVDKDSFPSVSIRLLFKALFSSLTLILFECIYLPHTVRCPQLSTTGIKLASLISLYVHM